jgi:succinate-semialdehyde dehydrogenase/glutarate-semialdehyde dehydrogenase
MTKHRRSTPPPKQKTKVLNPATGKHLATLPKMRGGETLTAIAAAHSVFPQWSGLTAKQRGAVLYR